MKSLALLYNEYFDSGTAQRLGQYFVNNYIKRFDGDLEQELWEADNHTARKVIEKWLIDHQYIETLPPRVR